MQSNWGEKGNIYLIQSVTKKSIEFGADPMEENWEFFLPKNICLVQKTPKKMDYMINVKTIF